MNKIYKYRNAPQIILTNYKLHLQQQGKTFESPGTDDQRGSYIIEYIDFIINVYPKYKKFLKLHNLKSYQIGLMIGYKNAPSWHGSYRKLNYMRFVVNLISLHKELLETI